MGKLEYFIRFALILGVLCIVSMFLCDPFSEGFYLSLVGFVLCLVVTVVGVILTKKRKE